MSASSRSSRRKRFSQSGGACALRRSRVRARSALRSAAGSSIKIRKSSSCEWTLAEDLFQPGAPCLLGFLLVDCIVEDVVADSRHAAEGGDVHEPVDAVVGPHP